MLNKSQPHARAGDAVENVREIRPAQPNVVRIDAHKDVDPLQSFKSELPRWRTLSWNKGTLAVLAGTILVVGVSVGAAALYLGTAAPSLNGASVPSLSGHVTLNSRPEGVVVSVDGVATRRDARRDRSSGRLSRCGVCRWARWSAASR